MQFSSHLTKQERNVRKSFLISLFFCFVLFCFISGKKKQ